MNFFECHQVEALKNHRVTDMACGSGDAQTLCITDDDTVWSWGDGDYGKLGMWEFSPCLSPHWPVGLGPAAHWQCTEQAKLQTLCSCATFEFDRKLASVDFF